MDPLDCCKIYTPAPLANAMVNALGDQPDALWLEPSHGTGTFVEAISRLGVCRKRIVAVDLDPVSSPADKLAQTFRGVDFLGWARQTNQRFDRVVGNPPFLPITRLPPSLKESAGSVIDFNGCPVGEGSNLWYCFVLASIRLLKCGGSLAFVLPSAAEFADYSAAIRQAVGKTFSRLEIYRCERPLFDKVQEGTVVGIARGYGVQPFRMRRQHFRTREGLIQALSKGNIRNGHRCPSGRARRAGSTVTMDKVAEIRLGGVTGDASYFLMNEERRQELELPTKALLPVVSKARHLQSAFVDEIAWNKLKSAGERIWLLNPSKRLAKHAKVKSYLELKPTEGGCVREAYKVSRREPWYQTPMPKTPHAFISGMSQHGPWLCINEMRGLNATNTLYVVAFRNEDRKTWYMWALALLTSVAQRQIRRLGRKYADGLVKYEPGSLSKIRLPLLQQDVDYKSFYEQAVNAFLGGDRAKAMAIADSALPQSNPSFSLSSRRKTHDLLSSAS